MRWFGSVEITLPMHWIDLPINILYTTLYVWYKKIYCTIVHLHIAQDKTTPKQRTMRKTTDKLWPTQLQTEKHTNHNYQCSWQSHGKFYQIRIEYTSITWKILLKFFFQLAKVLHVVVHFCIPLEWWVLSTSFVCVSFSFMPSTLVDLIGLTTTCQRIQIPKDKAAVHTHTPWDAHKIDKIAKWHLIRMIRSSKITHGPIRFV